MSSANAGIEQTRPQLLNHILDLETRLQEVLQAGPSGAWLQIDLTVPQLKTLLVIASAGRGDPVRMSALGHALHASVSSMTGIVDRLVERGLVERAGNPEDRRIVLVRLSPAGREALSRLYSIGQQQLSALLERVSTEELAIVARTMDILQRAAIELREEALATPPPSTPAQDVAPPSQKLSAVGA